ncbi:hypothetical protein SERLA73DRAFT_120143 [Serpula lacrymans var. lacrymans S7.3]|uniref:Uncharacterized protein n=1 Tax=Serpula lacrymans var. lacrymans (strain S7.3) TaxID=936435 RepID=F8PPV2_SERL3|nr:hypothetical protein SERLA73DRAFT_120143 [Serpula lacrymans var. lacrymans S7.3]
MVNHIPQPPRPQSQPQAPGRPSSQAGPSHTPRSTQAQLTPGSGHLSQARIPPAPQPHQSPHQPPHPAQQLSIAPRPAPPPVPAATPSSSAPSTMASSDGGPSTASRQQQQNL